MILVVAGARGDLDLSSVKVRVLRTLSAGLWQFFLWNIDAIRLRVEQLRFR